jgi:chromosome segregation ATPase
LSGDVDRKLQEQIARRAELDALKSALDGVAEQVVDSQHKLDSVKKLQTTLVPLVAEVNKLRSDITAVGERLSAVKFTEGAAVEQEKRYTDLVASSRTIAEQVAEHSRRMHALGEELARSTKMKDEMIADIERVQARHRDTVSQIHASEDQLARAEAMFKQLEARRSQVAFGEKKLAAVETRLAEIKQLATELDKSLASLANREQLVNAVRAEVENVHHISARSKADLAHVTQHTQEVTALKTRVDLLLSRIAETDERIASIDARRKLVDEVQTKANAIVHVLEDVRVNLETLGEQKTVIDHVAEKVAQLDFMLQEARNAMRSLQHERELAERIEQGIKQLRTRTAAGGADEKKAATA